MLYSDNHAMRRAIRDDGFEVPVMDSWNLVDDTTVARLSRATI